MVSKNEADHSASPKLVFRRECFAPPASYATYSVRSSPRNRWPPPKCSRIYGLPSVLCYPSSSVRWELEPEEVECDGDTTGSPTRHGAGLVKTAQDGYGADRLRRTSDHQGA